MIMTIVVLPVERLLAPAVAEAEALEMEAVTEATALKRNRLLPLQNQLVLNRPQRLTNIRIKNKLKGKLKNMIEKLLN
jgi:hypothetical protein